MSGIIHVPTPHSYSIAVAAGDFVFLGLHRGFGETFAAQFESVFAGLKTTLAQFGLGLDSLVKVNVWLKHIEDLPEMEKRTRDHFAADAFPARMTSTTEFIDADCLLMIEGTAYRGEIGGTMDEVARIRDQIARSLEGEAWHGPPLMAVLSGLDAASASARPIPDAHTPWEILLHITAWAEVTVARLRGEAPELSDAEDWPTPAGGDDAWQADVERLRQVHQELLEELATLDPSRLDAPILPGYSSVYVTLHGMVQHNLYHGGQIAILKKWR